MKDIFGKATQQRLRYVTPIGSLATEDLWKLSLELLNLLAIDLRSTVESLTGDSFIEEVKPDPKTLLAFEVVKYVINVKLEERKAAKDKRDLDLKKSKLLELIAKKQDEGLSSLSIAELTKQFDDLG